MEHTNAEPADDEGLALDRAEASSRSSGKKGDATPGPDGPSDDTQDMRDEGERRPLPTDVDASAGDASEQLTFEQRLDALSLTVSRQSEHREIMLGTLAFCEEAKEEPDVESHIQGLPEWRSETQSPFSLIVALVRAHGLDRFELDEQGEVITDERKRGLSEDEADDLVWSVSYQTTDVGMTLLEDMRPKERLARLIAARPQRRDTYVDVLRFCTTPRTRQEIEGLLRGRKILSDEGRGGEPLKPSVFIDKLERSGVLVWDGHWNTSEDGKAYLESCAARA
ncbi:MAG: hypothetical protein SOI24_10610 [Coriobacteriales bacterium]|jgi:hypothetical protein